MPKELEIPAGAPRYRTVVFIGNGYQSEFDRWYVEYDESTQQGFEYLLHGEYGQEGEVADTPPWGWGDTVDHFKDGDLSYVVSHNWNLSYVALTEIIEED